MRYFNIFSVRSWFDFGVVRGSAEWRTRESSQREEKFSLALSSLDSFGRKEGGKTNRRGVRGRGCGRRKGNR
jgi:hypothetical protein